MSDKSADPTSKVVHLDVEADTHPAFIELDLGARLEWINRSHHCPHFEIVFEGESPVEQNDELRGTLHRSVSIQMPKKKKEFFYKVVYKREDDTPCKESPVRSIRICPGGHAC